MEKKKLARSYTMAEVIHIIGMATVCDPVFIAQFGTGEQKLHVELCASNNATPDEGAFTARVFVCVPVRAEESN